MLPVKQKVLTFHINSINGRMFPTILIMLMVTIFKIKEIDTEKVVYEKPLFEPDKGMRFTEEIWNQFNGNKSCMQCSGCHGCR